jgi:hypothetical protein
LRQNRGIAEHGEKTSDCQTGGGRHLEHAATPSKVSLTNFGRTHEFMLHRQLERRFA